jgi:hypothetical protein
MDNGFSDKMRRLVGGACAAALADNICPDAKAAYRWRRLDQGDTDQSMIALELHAQGIDERLNSMFSGAIDTLRRNGETGEDACPCWSGSRRP